MNPTYLTSVQKGPPPPRENLVARGLHWPILECVKPPPPRENLVARGLTP